MQSSLNSYKLASSEIPVKDLKVASSKQQNFSSHKETQKWIAAVYNKVRTEALLTFPLYSTWELCLIREVPAEKPKRS